MATPELGGPGREALRWGGSLLLVAALHVGGVMWLMRGEAPVPPDAAPEVVMLELPPAAEPAATPAEAAAEPTPAVVPPPPAADPPAPEAPPPPPPKPPPPEPMPVEVPPPEPPLPVVPRAEVVMPTTPPPPMVKAVPKPIVRPRPVPRPVARPTEPREMAQAMPAAAAAPVLAPAPVAVAPPPAPASNAVPNWRSEISAKLQRAKRYPDMARSRGDEGTAMVNFTMDRAGHVLSVSLVRSSGVPSLDEEAVALVRRADPLPPMPAEVPGQSYTWPVPISFKLH